MSALHNTIKEINSSAATTFKMEVLKKNQDNEELKNFFKLCFDPFTTFGIKKIPKYTTPEVPTISYESFVTDSLPLFANRTLTGNAAINNLSHLLSCMSEEDQDLAIRIIKRDPDCGVGEKTVNKVWKRLIPIYPCLLCSAYDESLIRTLNLKNGVFIQEKSDGLRINIVRHLGITTVFTRQGHELNVNGHFDSISVEGKVIDGEMLFYDNKGKILSRKEGNGLGNKANRGTISDEEISRSFIVAWDLIPYEDFLKEYSPIPYRERLKELSEIVEVANSNKLVLTKTDLVHSIDEIQAIYLKYLADGQEGAVVKSQETPWSNTRSPLMIKMKATKECDLIITGFIDGKDALEGLMGALTCQTSDGLLKVNVGGGFSTHQRAQYYANYYNTDVSYVMGGDIPMEYKKTPDGSAVIGAILPTKYNSVIQAESGGWSLFLPRASHGSIRLDKTEADTLEQI